MLTIMSQSHLCPSRKKYLYQDFRTITIISTITLCMEIWQQLLPSGIQCSYCHFAHENMVSVLTEGGRILTFALNCGEPPQGRWVIPLNQYTVPHTGTSVTTSPGVGFLSSENTTQSLSLTNFKKMHTFTQNLKGV